MPKVKVEIKIWCECGEELHGYPKEISDGIIVEMCKKCRARESERAFNEGYKIGKGK